MLAAALFADVAASGVAPNGGLASANAADNQPQIPAKSGASTEPPRELPMLVQFNASGMIGVAVRDDARGDAVGIALGLRPEIIFGRRSASSFGVGPYGEAYWMSGQGSLEGAFGGGLSLVVPTGARSALVPSVGASWTGLAGRPLEPALVAGAFYGFRRFNDASHFDASCGLRIDGRLGLGELDERAVIVSLQLDLTVLGALSFVFFK